MISVSARKLFHRVLIALVVLSMGFALSSGILYDVSKKMHGKVMADIKVRLYHHIVTMPVPARHYFLLPPESYSKELLTQPLPFAALINILFNSVFNMLFQPVFLCSFTPQVIINVVLFPFFLYAAVRYFKKVWVMLAVFIALALTVCTYDSVIEALIRHGMSCELIYILIGLGGFTGWITKDS